MTPVRMTKRLTMRLTTTRPTFCAKVVTGRTPKNDPNRLPTLSAMTPPRISSGVGSRSNAPLVMPLMLPTVSTAVATNRMHIAMMACRSKVGMTGMNFGRANQAASASGLKSTMPRQMAST